MKPELKQEIASRSEDIKKAIKVYTIELLVFAVVFVTLGILEILHVIGNNEGFRNVFTYITLVGAGLLIADWVWALASKKRRARVSLFDKFLTLPGPICIVVLDILTLINGVEAMKETHHYLVGAVFCYLGLAYAIQAIYHYFYPLPMLLEEVAKEAEEEEEEEPMEDEDPKEKPEREEPEEKPEKEETEEEE